MYTQWSHHTAVTGPLQPLSITKVPMSSVIVILSRAPPFTVPVALLLLPLACAGSRSYINLLLTKKSGVFVCDRCHKEN